MPERLFERAKKIPETVLGSEKVTVNLSAIAGALIPMELRRLDPLFPGREWITRLIEIGVPAGLAGLGSYLKSDELHTAGIVGTACGIAHGLDSAGEYGYERVVPDETKVRLREAEIKAKETVARVLPPKEVVAPAPAVASAKPKEVAEVPGRPYHPGAIVSTFARGEPFATPVSRKAVVPLP
jgi:hypothetical protein